MLRLQPFDFRVVHLPGRDTIADPLSRLLGKSTTEEAHEHEAEEYVRFVATNATPRALTTRDAEEASAADKELREVRTRGDTYYFTTQSKSQGPSIGP